MNTSTQLRLSSGRRSLKVISHAMAILAVATTLHAQILETNEEWVGPMGPNGGWGGAIAIDQQAPAVVYVSIRSIFKSTNGGTSWTAKNHGVVTSRRITDIVIDPEDSSTLYALTHYGGEIYKSVDAGESWQSLVVLGINGGVSLAINPVDTSVLYAAVAGNGVFKSTDAGTTWNRLTGFPGPASGGLTIDPQSVNTLYVGTSSGVAKSTDGGTTWTTSNEGLIGTDLTVFDIAVDPATPSTLFIVVAGSGCFRSTDGGLSWIRVFQYRWFRVVRIDPRTPSTVYASGSSAVFKSTDSGATWISSEPGFGASGIIDIAIDPRSPSHVYATAINCCDLSPAVVKSTDGGLTWAPANEGIKGLGFFTIDPLDSTRLYGANGWGGAFRSTDGGDTWERFDKDAAGTRIYAYWSPIVAPPAADAWHLYSTSSSGFLKSSDRGDSWTLSNEGLPGSQQVGPVAVDTQTPSTLYLGAPEGIFKSLDTGDSWTLLDPDIANVMAIAIHPSDSTTLFAGTWGSGLFRSTDGGLHWAQVHPHPWWEADIAIDASSNVYAPTNSGLLKSMDGGTTWTLVFSKTTYKTLIDPLDPRILYIGTAGNGLFRSADAGATWVSIKGLPDTEISISSMDFDPQLPSTVYVLFRGVYRITFSPRVFSVAPASGLPGDSVVLTGKNFRPGRGDGTVTFNGAPAPVVSWGDREIVVQVPEGSSTGPVVVTVLGVPSNTDQSFTLEYVPVAIDIKPGSFPNIINLRSRGNIPVAIFSAPGFDASEVDPSTVTLANAPVRLNGRGSPQATLEDVDGDGRPDLVVHIDTRALELGPDDVEAILEGQTVSGTPIRGSDSVRIVR